MPGLRRYDDPCGVARALDLVGERWALLIVRELLFGPKRFTDLRRGLRAASQNVLSQRLRDLESADVVRRARLGPPVSAWVYELTDRGRGLRPVLEQLAVWGSRAALTSDAELSADALALALTTTFDRAAAGTLRARYDLRLGDDRFSVVVDAGRFELSRADLAALDGTRGTPGAPDVVIETDAATLRSLVFGGRPLPEALAAGAVRVTGDLSAAERFLTLFPRPRPSSSRV